MRIIINIKPDFIYITHRHPWTLFIIILKPFLKFKLFYTYHDNPWDKKEKENLILIFIDKMLGKLSDLIVVHSYFMKENLKKYLKKEIFVMPLGPYFIFEKYKKENFNLEKELNLGFLGRIFPYKGLEVLLKAVNELQEEGLKINCFILGKGNLSDKEKELIEKTNSIIENRWLDNKEIIDFCSKKIDVVVLPYKMATQSGVISLCLAIGIPLIVSNVGGLKEFVKDGFNGFVFDIRDINELKSKIKKIYFNRSLLIEFSKNIDLIKKEFDWAKYIKEFADKFLSIP